MSEWNRAFALEQTGGDEELLEELLHLFRESSAADLNRLRQGVARASSVEVTRAAHSIKGAAASLGFETIRQVAAAIEQDGRNDSVAVAAAELPRLSTLLETLPGV